MDLSARSTLPELMDDATLDPDEYRACLADLAAVNRLTLTHRATLKFLAKATAGLPRGAAVSVLDVAFGQGDLLRAIAAWAETRGLVANLTGVDLNPRSAAAAAALTAAPNIAYHTGDVFTFLPATPPDYIVTSQFTHHLTDAQIARFLTWLNATARRGWHVCDLHRHRLPYAAFPWLCRLMRWHRIVRHDGAISIARGFTRAEWQHSLAAAGVAATIRWCLPFRHAIWAIK